MCFGRSSDQPTTEELSSHQACQTQPHSPQPYATRLYQLSKAAIGASLAAAEKPPARFLGDADPGPMASWDEPDDLPRTAAEVLLGLDQTWRVIRACLAGWAAYDSRKSSAAEVVLRPRSIRRLMEYDLHHGGELAFVLGANGLAAPQL